MSRLVKNETIKYTTWSSLKIRQKLVRFLTVTIHYQGTCYMQHRFRRWAQQDCWQLLFSLKVNIPRIFPFQQQAQRDCQRKSLSLMVMIQAFQRFQWQAKRGLQILAVNDFPQRVNKNCDCHKLKGEWCFFILNFI